ncbi:MAG TPA: maleylpyruvate isomerase N-terminal domain-containing protein [Candidatus Dormibacteraeota bacterium]|jgi:maleylpyruvate isomerase
MGEGVPHVVINGTVRSHAALAARIDGLTDEVARRPSRLPDWSVGHVLSHIARNADSVVRRLAGSAEGHIVDQYAGGAEGRKREIEAGAGRPADELVADVLRTNGAVEAVLARFPMDGWDRLTRSVDGQELPARSVIFSRWREVEVHQVDLGLGYEPGEWPDDLVELWLPQAKEQFLTPADDRDLLAWLVGRGPAPRLAPWG